MKTTGAYITSIQLSGTQPHTRPPDAAHPALTLNPHDRPREGRGGDATAGSWLVVVCTTMLQQVQLQLRSQQVHVTLLVYICSIRSFVWFGLVSVKISGGAGEVTFRSGNSIPAANSFRALFIHVIHTVFYVPRSTSTKAERLEDWAKERRRYRCIDYAYLVHCCVPDTYMCVLFRMI